MHFVWLLFFSRVTRIELLSLRQFMLVLFVQVQLLRNNCVRKLCSHNADCVTPNGTCPSGRLIRGARRLAGRKEELDKPGVVRSREPCCEVIPFLMTHAVLSRVAVGLAFVFRG